jgi:hypothetical protein
MHACMQDDRVNQKFLVLAPADMDYPFNRHKK